MTKVKTLVESLKQGHVVAFENLNHRVEDLGDIVIEYIKDTIYPERYGLDQEGATHLGRVIIYKEKSTVKAEPWKPTLDTDLTDFLAASQPNKKVRDAIEEACLQGKTSIRELIAMPYGWFTSIECGGKTWGELRKTLNRYGIKLYKKGYVVKD